MLERVLLNIFSVISVGLFIMSLIVIGTWGDKKDLETGEETIKFGLKKGEWITSMIIFGVCSLLLAPVAVALFKDNKFLDK